MFTLIYVWINGWVNNREADDLRRYRAHSDVIVMHMCALSYLPVYSTSSVSMSAINLFVQKKR